MSDNEPNQVSQNPALIEMIEYPPRIVVSQSADRSYKEHPESQLTKIASGPTRRTRMKPSPRKSPYQKPRRNRSTAPSPEFTKPELCLLLDYENPELHCHSASEVETKLGWYSFANEFNKVNFSATKEARLRRYLDARFPTRLLTYEVAPLSRDHHQPKDLLDSLNPAGITDLRNALPEVEGRVDALNATNLAQVPHQIDIAHDFRHSTSSSPLSWNGSDDSAFCGEKAPWIYDETQEFEDAIRELDRFHAAQKARNRSPSPLSLPPTTLSVEYLEDTSPDMRWKPCSMLDSYGTGSTDALRAALPEVPDTDVNTSSGPHNLTKQSLLALERGLRKITPMSETRVRSQIRANCWGGVIASVLSLQMMMMLIWRLSR